jgi:hypothetical protein
MASASSSGGKGFGHDTRRVQGCFLSGRGPAGGVGICAKAQRAASPLVFVEEIGGEIDPIPYPSAQQIDDGTPGGLAHQIVAGHFHRTVDLAHPPEGQMSLAPGRDLLFAKARVDALADGVELEGVFADDNLPGCFQRGQRAAAAGHFAQAVGSVVGHKLDDDAQGIGRVQARCVEQGGIADGNGGDVHIGNTHGRPFLLG